MQLRTAKWTLGVLLCSCFCTTSTNVIAAADEGRDVWFFVLVKSNNFSQSADGELTLLNYHFFSEVFGKKPGVIKTASLNRLGTQAPSLEFVDRGDTFYFEGGHFKSVEAVDAAHPNGEYRFNIALMSGQLIDTTMSLSGPDGSTDIPKPIQISLYQSSEEVSPQKVDSHRPLTVRWSPYSNGRVGPNGIVDDMIFVVFQDCHGERVFHTGLPFRDPEYVTYVTTEVVVPEGRFGTGQVYSMFVEFPHVVDSTIAGGIPGFTSYATATYMDIVTLGESTVECPENLPPLDTGQTDRMEVDVQ